ncbi:MAG TPA: hypothetical protein VIK69_12045 [Methylophilaceae bacterium]
MALLDFLVSRGSTIGDIQIMATLEEVHTDTIQASEHPIERGAAITDHAYKKPAEVLIRCGWTDSSFTALVGSVSSLFQGGSVGDRYIDGVYSQLLALQESRQPFTIVTGLRQYDNMLIQSLRVDRDQKTSNALMVTAICRQVIIVETQATQLPPREAQRDPASTAEVENTGVKLATPATPSPGGSVPPTAWVEE